MTGWCCHSNSVSCIHWFAHRGPTEARTITSSDHLWRELCWRRAASCASLICCLKMLLIGLCYWMNKLYSCCFLDENPLGGWSAAVHLGTEEWGGFSLWCHLDAQVCYMHRYTNVLEHICFIVNLGFHFSTLWSAGITLCTFYTVLSPFWGKTCKYFSRDLRHMYTDTVLGYKGTPDQIGKLLKLIK